MSARGHIGSAFYNGDKPDHAVTTESSRIDDRIEELKKDIEYWSAHPRIYGSREELGLCHCDDTGSFCTDMAEGYEQELTRLTSQKRIRVND